MNEYYKTKESVEEYIELAKDVNSSQIIDKLKNFVSEQKSLLEIGSGPGTDYEILKRYFDVTGSDFSEEFLKVLSARFPDDDFLNLNAITLETEKKFDIIYSNKVFQHLTDEEIEESIKNQVRILNEGGIICHTFWKGEGEESFKGMFVKYQSLESLKKHFSKEFEILALEEYKEFEENDSLLIIARLK